MGICVCPRLAALTIWEVAIGATNSHVEDEVELSVEGSRVVLVDPGIVETAGIGSSLEETLLSEVHVQHNVGRTVNVGVESVLVPVEAIGVPVLIKVNRRNVVSVSLLVLILRPVDSPVESGAKGVDSSS